MPFLPQSKYELQQPEWSKNAVIYQVNTRQFSEQGTFEGVKEGLDHIQSLGADIIWLMPIHPIGEKNRKGELGSPYAVKDYLAINPEFGDEHTLSSLIQDIHQRNMKVILDWVPNHSAWDNALVSSNPHWYARDYKGDFRPSPWWDWDDIIEFDYDNPALREYMIDAMRYWVKEFDIDGFRCDVAGYVPNDFWEQARHALDEIKPVFLLAEWENRDLHEQAFNMSYAWSWQEVMENIAHGRLSLDKLRKYYSWNERSWPKSAYRMTFVTNHDINAWEGTQKALFADALEPTVVLSVLGEGMPLIHNGQEAGDSKQLAFFQRDPIEWREDSVGALYKHLIRLKKKVPALWNGPYGATMIQVPSDDQRRVFSFVRMQDKDKVMVLLNLSPDTVAPKFDKTLFDGEYQDAMSGKTVMLDGEEASILPPWAFRVYLSRG